MIVLIVANENDDPIRKIKYNMKNFAIINKFYLSSKKLRIEIPLKFIRLSVLRNIKMEAIHVHINGEIEIIENPIINQILISNDTCYIDISEER